MAFHAVQLAPVVLLASAGMALIGALFAGGRRGHGNEENKKTRNDVTEGKALQTTSRGVVGTVGGGGDEEGKTRKSKVGGIELFFYFSSHWHISQSINQSIYVCVYVRTDSSFSNPPYDGRCLRGYPPATQ